MTGDELSLADRREALRGQLHAQRERLALRLAPGARGAGCFPRSVTMRVLMERPELLSGLTTYIGGPAFASKISTMLELARVLSTPPHSIEAITQESRP